MMRTFQRGEKGAVRLVLTLAERYGYGNLIAWLKAGWAEKLMADGVSEYGAIAAGRVSGYPVSYLEDIRPPDWRADSSNHQNAADPPVSGAVGTSGESSESVGSRAGR